MLRSLEKRMKKIDLIMAKVQGLPCLKNISFSFKFLVVVVLEVKINFFSLIFTFCDLKCRCNSSEFYILTKFHRYHSHAYKIMWGKLFTLFCFVVIKKNVNASKVKVFHVYIINRAKKKLNHFPQIDWYALLRKTNVNISENNATCQ